MGCCAGVAYLDENWSWFLVIRHVAKLDFMQSTSKTYECLI